MKTCSVCDCDNLAKKRGMCPKHYERARRGQDFLSPSEHARLADLLCELFPDGLTTEEERQQHEGQIAA